jgi:hypothetical protein
MGSTKGTTLPLSAESASIDCRTLSMAFFYQWYMNQTAVDPYFFSSVLVTVEAKLIKDAVFNCHNMHIWKHENPHVTSASTVLFSECVVWVVG